jgi:replication-associated recombination protein RarA
MNQISESVNKVLRENPENIEVLKRIVEFVENNSENRFEWHQVRIHPAKLKSLFLNGILEVVYKSNTTTVYSLVDFSQIKESIETFEKENKNAPYNEKFEIPNNLFDGIINYDDIKNTILHSLKNGCKVHFLFCGPPATAKSLFLEKLRSLPKSFFCIGSMMTKAGLAQVMIEHKPKILLLDEMDKARKEDLSVLLNILQNQEIVITKHNQQFKEKTDVVVFATVNRIDRIPEEIKSRFLVFKLSPYDKEDFIKVSVNYLTNGQGKSEELARYIAETVWNTNLAKDIRTVINIAKISFSLQDAEKNIQTLLKYR